ncbi:MAG: S9 family peptidase [Myxococcales bacterium]|nr:S9 family peptidase [Myxococcales bacterium]
MRSARDALAAAIACCAVGLAPGWAEGADEEVAPALSHARVPVASFFDYPRIANIRVSAKGTYFGLVRPLEDGLVLAVVHRASEELLKLAEVRGRGWLYYRWLSDDWLAVQTFADDGTRESNVVRLAWNEKAHRLGQHAIALPTYFDVVDTLPQKETKILVGGSRDVGRIDLAKLERDGWESQFTRRNIVATRPDPVLRWLVDRRGAVRAAFVREVEGRGADATVRYRIDHRSSANGLWHRGSRFELQPGAGFAPLAFTEDGERLLVATNRDRDRYALVEVDPETTDEVAVVYEHPDAEIEDVVMDADGQELLGVELYRAGGIEYDYFEETFREYEAQLSAVVPDRTLRVTSVSHDRRVFSVLAYAPQHTVRHYIVDTEAKRALDLGPTFPALEGVALSPRTRFTTRAEGGPEIEAFYTVGGNAPERPALIVVPHGGPIGPRTEDGVDPLVQMLANRGYAVLEVNYRGSGGRGREFERAGHRQWGKGIEDDIDAAVDYVVERGWVDESRMAVVGGSYGGYSALMSAVRHPKRFRCVATLFGVTDLPLLFDHPAAQLSRAFRDLRVEEIGDPERDRDDMLAHSPVYRAAEIEVPVFIAQGGRDDRVDVEHAYRLRLMLEKHGKPFRWLVLRRKGHDLAPGRATLEMMDALLDFLLEHLGPNGPPALDSLRADAA